MKKKIAKWPKPNSNLTGHDFVPFGTKISKKNNLKQKSYKDFSFLKICKCVSSHKT